jgi:hypothetical protein
VEIDFTVRCDLQVFTNSRRYGDLSLCRDFHGITVACIT